MYITGRAVALAALGVVAALLFPQPLTVGVWAGLVALVVGVDVWAAPSARGLSVRRTATAAVRLGEHAESTVVVRNEGKRTVRLQVRDAWQPSAGAGQNRHSVVLPGGQARRVRTALNPTRRGQRLGDLVTLRSRGPLGVAGRQASVEAAASVLVLPPFRSRRHLPSRLALLREMDGRAAVMTRGQGTEFDSLREYVIGDDVRAIDWRATARAGDVVVRTWRPERDRRVLIVLDTGRLSAVRLGDDTRLDAHLEAALLLAALASHAGDRVDVVAVDTTVRARVSGQRGAQLMSTLARELAVVEPALVETDWTEVARVVHQTLSQRALVVLLTALDASSINNGILPVAQALAADHTVVVACATDPELGAMRSAGATSLPDDAAAPDDAAVWLAAAAERAGLEHAAAEVRLHRRGVEVVEAAAGELPPVLADEYLKLKRAGRL